MALESILERITEQANLEGAKIIQEARKTADDIIQQAKKEAEIIYRQILDKERALSEAEKQKLLVNARLESKKALLLAKQELIDQALGRLKSELKKERFKKSQVHYQKTEEVPEDLDFYLHNLRLEYESEIAGILF